MALVRIPLSHPLRLTISIYPEILRAEIKEFVQLWQKKKNKLMVTRGTPRRILDAIEKLICVES